MISEKNFAAEFSGFWAECLPYMTPQFVAAVNLDAQLMASGSGDWMKPIGEDGDNSRNDIVAEFAFGLFAESVATRKRVSQVVTEKPRVRKIESASTSRVDAFKGDYKAPKRLTTANRRDAVELAIRMERFFVAEQQSRFIVQPEFKGCGILDSCFGDVLSGKTLFEVKMVDRNLRGADVRQVLIYCALNHQACVYDIENMAIVNPRRGVFFAFNLAEFAERVSGMTSAELFHQIVSFVADFGLAQQTS